MQIQLSCHRTSIQEQSSGSTYTTSSSSYWRASAIGYGAARNVAGIKTLTVCPGHKSSQCIFINIQFSARISVPLWGRRQCRKLVWCVRYFEFIASGLQQIVTKSARLAAFHTYETMVFRVLHRLPLVPCAPRIAQSSCADIIIWAA